MMRVNIKSNFIVPGLESQEGIDLERSTITLRELLDELSERGPNRLLRGRHVGGGEIEILQLGTDLRGPSRPDGWRGPAPS